MVTLTKIFKQENYMIFSSRSVTTLYKLCIKGFNIFFFLRPCNCDREGSVSNSCDATGQCKCKENVIGKQCNQCKAGHFDLDTTNPKGCKACFCHGHGTTCTSARGIKSKIILSPFDTDADGWKLQDKYGK